MVNGMGWDGILYKTLFLMYELDEFMEVLKARYGFEFWIIDLLR